MLDQRAVVIAHGVLGSVAWVVFFPLGSVLMSVLSGPSTWKVHAAVQIFSMLVFTAAVGTGLQMALRFKMLDNYHVILGLAIFTFMVLQAIGGLVHHMAFKKHRRRTIISHVHIWVGRILITLGMVNGGLGLWVNGRSTTSQNIAYGVVVGVIWWGWMVTSAICEARKLDPSAVSSREKRQLARERRVLEREERLQLSRKRRMLGEVGSWL